MTENIVNAEKSAARWFRKVGGKVEYDDLLSAAQYGLFRAAARWKSDGGASFKTFAFNTMGFWILRMMRQQRAQSGWSYRPTKSEVTELGHTRMIQRVYIGQMPVNDDGEEIEFSDASTPDPVESIEQRERRELALQSASSDRERTILSMLLDGSTQQEIADHLGVTGSYICKLSGPLIEKAKRYVQSRLVRTN